MKSDLVMEKIDSGCQFNIYRRDDGKIVKQPKNRRQIYLTILKLSPKYFLNPFRLSTKVDELIEARQQSLERISEIELDPNIIADAKVEDGKIVQEEAKTVSQLIDEEALSWEEAIEDNIDLIIDCWRYGFSDVIFNFTINNGYRQGEMVLLDIGELSFDREHLRSLIEDKRWLKSKSYKWDLPLRKKDYYRKRMEEELTVEKLDEVWAENQN